MPKLNKYQNKSGHYILTGLNGRIVTFQVTNEGSRRLDEAGITPDEVFGRRVLLDLYTRGLVFIYGTGPGEIEESEDPRQSPARKRSATAAAEDARGTNDDRDRLSEILRRCLSNHAAIGGDECY